MTQRQPGPLSVDDDGIAASQEPLAPQPVGAAPAASAPHTADDTTGSTVNAVARPRGATRLERGATIGRYVILDQLGAGGMGVVYKAYDPELDRPIALKLLHGDDTTGGFRERLVREAQALARLSHPNVIAVHDVGTFGVNVFIAMEFVEGVTLRRWLEAEPRNQRAILDVFLVAGEGLAAAHRAGLVHRDFKPDNLIIGHDGRVRVLDFGLARAAAADAAAPALASSLPAEPCDLETTHAPTVGERPSANGCGADASPPAAPPPQTSATGAPPPQESEPSSLRPLTGSTGRRLEMALTRAGSVVGTPRFMAPEQHLGQPVDERADQFSFCVSLYYALYGQLPFDGDAIAEVREQVLAGRIADPPEGARVPRWLRQVVLRGLSPEPEDRHSEMNALLAALRRDPGALRRRRLLVAVATTALVVGLVGARAARRQDETRCLGGRARLAGAWDDARRRAVHDAFVATGLPYAEAGFAGVTRSLDAYANAWATMHVDACEATRVRGEQSEELLDLRMQCLGDRLEELRAHVDVLAHADAKVLEQSVQSAQSLVPLSTCSDAARLHGLPPPPDDGPIRQRVDARRQELARASALHDAGKYTEGIEIARAAAAAPVQYEPIDVATQLTLGKLYADDGNGQLAVPALENALYHSLAMRNDDQAIDAVTTLVSVVGDKLRRFDDAHERARLAEALLARLGHKDALRARLDLALAHVTAREGKYEDALRYGQSAWRLIAQAYGPEHSLLGRCANILGNTYYRQARYPEALDYYRRARALQEKLFGPDHPSVATSILNMANVLGDSGNHAESMMHYRRGIAILTRTLGANHPQLATAYNNMGDEYRLLGDVPHAIESYQHALAIWQQTLGPSHVEVADGLHNLGEASVDRHKPDEALAYYQRALSIRQQVEGTGANYADDLAGMGEAYLQQGKLDEAQAAFERSLGVWEKALGSSHPDLARALLGVGRVRLARGAVAEALPSLERARALREAQQGDPVVLADARFALAQAQWRAGLGHQAARALALLARATYASSGPRCIGSLAEMDKWLAAHR
jgi:serine/threonine protein kinase/tetratricopeptide (TPR) repeat protein